jgi:hypothetical protein
MELRRTGNRIHSSIIEGVSILALNIEKKTLVEGVLTNCLLLYATTQNPL